MRQLDIDFSRPTLPPSVEDYVEPRFAFLCALAISLVVTVGAAILV